ncbi:MAG: N-formylglutamate amidohydrolase, partial [Balneolaceae bacterium]
MFRNKKILPVITCEHAYNSIPGKYSAYFEKADEILQSHRGLDPGAKDVTIRIAKTLHTTPILFPWSRLLIEPNRSLSSA